MVRDRLAGQIVRGQAQGRHALAQLACQPVPDPGGPQPLNMADIEQKIHQSASTTPDGLRSQSNFVNNVWNHILLKPKHDPIDYITKCVTYNNMVVMVGKKIEVSSPDPVLVSALTKLDSVEYLVSSFLENLQKVVDSLHQ